MITNIGHVAIRARDIEESARFYCDVLGMEEAFRMYREDGTLGTIYLYVAEDQFVELFAGGVRECPVDSETIGHNHMCYQVADAAEALDTLRAKGAPIDRELKRGQSRCLQFWTHDPDGNRIEIMSLPPDSMQAEATRKRKPGAKSGE